MIAVGATLASLLVEGPAVAKRHAVPGSGVDAPGRNEEVMKKIALIVDDSPCTCAVLEDILSDLGYEVLVDEEIGRALETMATREVSVVFLDMMLPEAPGWALGACIRDYCVNREIPLIFISAIEPELLADLARNHHATAWISKPFTDAVVAQAVAEHVA